MTHKIKLLILVLVLFSPCFTCLADEPMFEISCGPWIYDSEHLNHHYEITTNQFKKMNSKDMAKIALYLAVKGNYRLNSNPNVSLDQCDLILPEKYKNDPQR